MKVTSLEALVLADEELGLEILEVLEAAREGVGQVAEEVLRTTGELHAEDLLAQWEGFARFCRERLRVEVATLMSALRIKDKDPAAEVKKMLPDAVAEDEAAEAWKAFWVGRWQRRFE